MSLCVHIADAVTTVCAIASRFSAERPGLYARLMHFAQLAASTTLITGTKNVEMCAAYILLSLYPIPAKRWEDQRSWLYLGLALRYMRYQCLLKTFLTRLCF
jgi:hypothetical protein